MEPVPHGMEHRAGSEVLVAVFQYEYLRYATFLLGCMWPPWPKRPVTVTVTVE
jgi:hypothetical protein